jgi:excinuclease ABC subunit A
VDVAGGGERGGRIIATGTPETIARTKSSHTGQFLARSLGTPRARGGNDREAA